MKVVLAMLNEDERTKGRGFMKRFKDRWDMKYPELESASWQKLRDNAARFKKNPEIKNLSLVQQSEDVQVVEVAIQNNPEEEGHIVEPVVNNDEEEQVAVDVTTGIKPNEGNENRPKKAEGGNRRERKLKAEMKELR